MSLKAKKMGKTRGVHETTPELRNRMVGMYEAGLGLREIASALDVSQRTVKRWLNRFLKEGNVDTKGRCGRKRATTQEQDEAIVRLATQTSVTAAKAVIPALGLNCSVDTIRQRLHTAGIHNWTPSKKQILKININNNKTIHKSVWRPTGTSFGKKRSVQPLEKTKNGNSPKQEEKVTSQVSEPKSPESKNLDDIVTDDNVELADVQPSFTFPPLEQSGPGTMPFHDIDLLPPQSLPLPIPPPAPLHSTFPSLLPSNLNQYSIPFLSRSQSWFSSSNETSINQHWPIDPIHSFSFAQAAETPISMDHQLPYHLEPLQEETSSQNILKDQTQVNLSPQNLSIVQEMDQSNLMDSDLSNHPDNSIINVCSDVNSNSSCSLNDVSSINDDFSDNNFTKDIDIDNDLSEDRDKKKKGGKTKGTLETSVELRSRMIGMHEAGLSTLSIALAIDRSERTVKRWLDRWHKEGNVHTKKRHGRKRITTKEEDDAIIAMATQQPLTAAKFVAPALGLKCSVDTVRERLHKAGIHSWKLGKTQGEGNTLQTVHLWQPSGNRSNRPKISSDENKKSPAKPKKTRKTIRSKKKKPTKKKLDVQETTPVNDLEPQEPNVQEKIPSIETTVDQPSLEPSFEPSLSYSSEIEPQDLTTMLPVPQSIIEHQPPSLVHPQPHFPPLPPLPHISQLSQLPQLPQLHQLSQLPQLPPLGCPDLTGASQPLQPIGAILPPRPGCRLAFTAIPHMQNQATANLSYSSCMMFNNNHLGQPEQLDPINFEPYVWSF